MVSAMDDAIGRVVTALKNTGHYNNSVIIFTTDVRILSLFSYVREESCLRAIKKKKIELSCQFLSGSRELRGQNKWINVLKPPS